MNHDDLGVSSDRGVWHLCNIKLCADYSLSRYYAMLIDKWIRTFRRKFITPYKVKD